eukprot:SAG31_NODE_16669_length_700_cov_1.519135_1_plen_103_part_10
MHQRSILQLRDDSNRGFAEHDAERISKHWLASMVVTQATAGEHTVGSDANRAMLERMFSERPDVLYIRTSTSVVVASPTEEGKAIEEGRWVGTWSGVASRGEP